MSRKAEFYTLIRPLLDGQKDVKRDTIELAQELQDILDVVNIGSGAGGGFGDLKDAFNDVLVEMGKQPVVFADNTLKGIVSQFASAIIEGIQAGIDQGSKLIDTASLTKGAKKQALLDEKAQLQKDITNIKKYKQRINTIMPPSEVNDDAIGKKDAEKNDMSSQEKAFHAYQGFKGKDNATIRKEVQDAANAYSQLVFDIGDMSADMEEYETKVLEAVDALTTLHEMREKLHTSKDPEQRAIAEKYLSIEKLDDMSFIHDTDDGDSLFLQDIAQEILDKFPLTASGEIDIKSTRLKEIEQELLSLESQADSTADKIQEVNQALDNRLRKGESAGSKNIKPSALQNAQDALDYTYFKEDGKPKATLAALYNQYEASETGDFVDRYQALLKFVSAYQQYESSLSEDEKATDRVLKKYKENYQNLSQYIDDARQALTLFLETAEARKHSSGTTIASGSPNTPINTQVVNSAKKEKEATEATANASKSSLEYEKEKLKIVENLTDEYDEQIRLSLQQGERKETAGHIDSKTGRVDRFVVGGQYGVAIPGGAVTDYSFFGKPKPHFDIGVHSHWTNAAAPSPFVEGATDEGDLHRFKDRLNYQGLELIRAMEEWLLLDFSRISETALSNLIDDYDRMGAQIHQQFLDMPMSERLRQFGHTDVSEEEQVALREAFSGLVSQYDGFATWVQKPVWSVPEVEKNNRRKALLQQLDEHGKDTLDSRTADENLEKRKEIFKLLQNEGLLTEEIKNQYDAVNQRLEVRADLIREAESHYDDPDDILTGIRVDSVDSADQFRKDHIQPFDNVIAKMHDSGFFSEEELENSFEAISRSMEQRARNIAAKGVFDELDNKIVDPNTINDVKQLNSLLQERNTILNSVDEMGLIDYDHNAYADALKHNQLIEDRIALLQQTGDFDDAYDNIRRENGALEDKLELLRDIAEQYGSDITQKQRDRFEELNQKDMDSGLTTKEEERYWELGEKIDEADTALMEFEETYDRIILKLANGKKIEILPDDKGLRSLYEFADGYGDEFKGVEIEDVSFERAQAAVAESESLRQQLNDANQRVIDADERAQRECIDKELAEDALSQTYASLWEEEQRANKAEEELATLRQELAEKQGVAGGNVGNQTSLDANAETSRLVALKEAVEAVTTAVSLKTQAFQAEQTTVDNVVTAEITSLDKLSEKIADINGQFETLVNNIHGGSDDIGAGLSNVNINVNYPDGGSKVEFEPEVFDKLVTAINNTHPQVTDVGNVLATEGTLNAIKVAVEAINGKVIPRTVFKTERTAPTSNELTIIDERRGGSLSTLNGTTQAYNTPEISGRFMEQKRTALTDLLKYKTTLQEADQLHGDLEQGVNALSDELQGVFNKDDLTIWKEHFKQFKNASSILQTLVKDYEELGKIQAKITHETNAVKKAQYLDDEDIIKSRIAVKQVDVDVHDDRFDKARQQAYNLMTHELQQKSEINDENQRAQAVAKATAEAEKQEAKIVNKLTGLYKELGQAKAKQNVDLFDEDQIAKAYVDEARIRRQIKEQRSNLGAIDKDTNAQFKKAKDESFAVTTTDAKLVVDSKTRKQKVKDEAEALNTLLSLYKRYGALDAKWNYSNGQKEALEQERQMLEMYQKIQVQKASMGLSENDTRYDNQIFKAWEQGFKDIENAKLEARSKATDKSAAQRIQEEVHRVEKYVKQIGELEAELEFATGTNETAEINRQIQQKNFYINLKKEELSLDERRLKIQQTLSYQEKYNALALKERRAQDKSDTSNSKKKSSEVQAAQAAREAAIVQKLIGWYKELGQAKARQNKALFSDEQVTQAYAEYAQIRRLINTERAKLPFVNQDADMKFKGAKAEGYRLTTTNAERAAAGKATSQRIREETKAENDALSDLIALYKQLGQAEAKRDMTSQNNAEMHMADKEAQGIETQIAAKRKLIKINNQLENQFADSWMSGIESETKKPIKDLGKEYEKLGKLRAEVEKTPDGDYLKFLNQQLQTQQKLVEIESRRLGISDDLRNSYNQMADEAYAEKVNDINKKAAKDSDKQRAKEQAELFKQQIKRSKEMAKTGQAKSAIGKAEGMLESATSITGISGEHVATIQKYADALETLKKKYIDIQYSDGAVTPQQQEEIIAQTKAVDNFTKEIGELVAEYNRLSGDNATPLKEMTFDKSASIDEYKRQLTEAVMAHHDGKATVTGFNAATKELYYTVKDGKYGFVEYTASARHLDKQLVTLQGNTKKLETPIEKLKRKMSEILTYFGGSSLIYEAFAQLRQGIQYVREIDLALTELKKVTDETEESYDRFLQTASKTADRVGSTIQKIVSSTADWARLGFDMQEAAELAESTSVLLNVSEFNSIEDATSALTSTMQAFGYVAEDSMHVVDVLNEVGNNFAISSDGIATALQDSASALMAANNSYEEAVSLIAAANRVVQDPNSVGAALRTISLRLRGTSVKELESAGEDTTGVITSKSKLRSKIKTLSGVDILTDTGAYKSTYQILLEISKVWEKMNDVDQAALLEILAGKNRANTAMAILSNTTDLEEAYVQALEAEGSALKENETYLNSIQGRIDQFNNAVQTMWSNTLDDELIKDIVNLGTEIIKLVDKIGLVRTALGAWGLSKFIPWLAKLITDTNTFGGALKKLLTPLVTVSKTGDTIAQVFKTTYDGAKVAKGGIINLAASFKAAKTALTAFLNTPLGWFTMAAVAIGAVVAIVDACTVSLEEQTEILQKSRQAYEDSERRLDSFNDELETTQKRIKELQGFDALTIVEQEELKRLQEENNELERRIKLEEKANAAAEKEQAKEAVETYKKLPTTTRKDNEVKSYQDTLDSPFVSYMEDKDAWDGYLGSPKGMDLQHLSVAYEKAKTLHDEYIASIEDDNLKLKYLEGYDELGIQNMTEEEKKEALSHWDAATVQNSIDAAKDVLEEIEAEAFKLISDETTGYQSLLDSMAPRYEKIMSTNQKLWSESDIEIVETYQQIESTIQSIWQKFDPAGWLELSTKEIWGDERFKHIYDSLAKLSQDGELDEKELRKNFGDNIVNALVAACEDKGVLLSDILRDFLTRFNRDDESVQPEEPQITDSLSKITALEEAFNSLGEAVQEFKEEGTASASTLEDLYETFKDVEGFEELYKVLATGEGNVEEAITNVANAYITQKDILSNVTDEELDIMVSRLESLGVINAQEILQNRQKIQQDLNDNLVGYNVDLSNYATAEEAKLAVAQLMTSDILSAVVGMETQLAEQYGINLADFVSTEKGKVVAAKEAAREIAKANKSAALSSLNQEYLENGYTLSELGRSEGYRSAKQAILDEYNSVISDIDAIDETLSVKVGAILDNYYSQSFNFDFSGKQLGIGRNFDENYGDDEETKEAKDAFDKLRKQYEGAISHLENEQTYLENEVERLETQGEQVGRGVYKRQIDLEKEKLTLLEKEKAALLKQMKTVPVDSELWQEYADAVWEVDHAIQDSTLSIIEHQQAITNLYVDVFDKLQKAYDNMSKLYEHQQNFINNDIEYAELTDTPISADYYKQLRDIQQKDYDNKMAEIAELERLRDDALARGDINLNDNNFVDDEKFVEMQFGIYEAKLEAQEFRNEIEKTNEELRQLYVTAFDKVGEAFGALNDLYADRASYTEGYIELQGLRGEPVSTGAYDYLIENETNSLSANLNALDAQRQKLQEAINNGVKIGSEEWITMESEIRATEKAIQDNRIAIEQYNEELKALYSEAFNKVRDSFGDVNAIYDDQQAFIDSYINYLETMDVAVPDQMYKKLISLEKQKKQNNTNLLHELQTSLAKMEAEGYTPEDEEWVQAQADIRAVEKAIWDSEVAVAEFNKRIREMETEKFEEFIKRIGDMVSELDRVYDLLSKEDIAEEDGTWTEEGIATLGLLYQKMEISKKQIADYQEEIEKLNDEYKSGAISEQEYNDRLVELKESQWDAIGAYEDAKDAIVDINEARIDMIEEGINKEIEAYQELIDMKKKELDAERDLYTFRKDIQKQSKDITSLERRIAAMSGSTDAATIAERTKLEAQLREAREALDDSYYNHAMDSQSTALDDENESYTKSKEDYIEQLREALEDVESIVANTMSQVLINADTVLGELNGVSGEYGITLSESLTAPWIGAAQQAEAFKNSAIMQEYEFAVQNDIFTGEIIADFSALFSQTTGMANQFNTDVYTVMEAIKLHTSNATSQMTSDLVIPFSTAMGYAYYTFAPNTQRALEDVAGKAHGLVLSETTDIQAPWLHGTEAANTFKDTATTAIEEAAKKAAEYSPSLQSNLTSPITEADGKWSAFGTTVKGVLDGIITKAQEAATNVGADMTDIITKAKNAAQEVLNTYGVKPPVSGTPKDTTPAPTVQKPAPTGLGPHNRTPSESDVKYLQTALNHLFNANLNVDGKLGSATSVAIQRAQKTMYLAGNESMKSQDGLYGTATRAAMVSYIDKKINSLKDQGGSSMIGQAVQRYYMVKNMLPKAFYAKGTTGTQRDEWAMTDEIGDELVLIPGKGGNLQYMRKGTAVIPADISANLMEWGKLNPNMDMSGAVQGINLMTNVVNKPELNLSFEALVKAEHITEETLPAVKKLVTEELDKFSRKLNYNLKRVGGIV